MWTRKGDNMSWDPPEGDGTNLERRRSYARQLQEETDAYRAQLANEDSEKVIIRTLNRSEGAAFLRTLWYIHSLPERSI